jgi:hypothetical protein
MENEPPSQPPQSPPPVPEKRSGPSLPVEVLAAVGLIVALLGLLAFFSQSHTEHDNSSAAVATRGDTAGVAAAAGAAAEAVADVPTFDIFRHPESNPGTAIPVKDQDKVRSSDGFTFELHNRTGKPTHFMLFAMDASDTMFWFFPQVDPQKQHVSLPLGPIPNAIIPEGVTPGDVKPGVLRVVGLFTPEPVTILEVEDGFRQHGPQGVAQALHGSMHVVTLRLEAQ